MPVTSMPAFWIDRMAVAARARALDLHVDLAHAVLHGPAGRGLGSRLGGVGVDLRTLNPTLPADAHDRTLPSWSVKLMIVLLKLLLMCVTP